MRKIILISSVLLISCLSSFGQILESYTLKRSWSTQQIDSFYTAQGLPSILLPQAYDVDIYQLKYNTVSYDGVTPTFASGMLVIPKNKSCASPILSYQHGTVLKRVDAPSNLNGEYVIGIAMGADGYIGVMPDYLGLGLSTTIHPYVHAASEARAVADMIRASREACDLLNVDYNDQVFLTGYSQGGHSTMAAHRYLVENFPSEFHVQASVPMSGPYSLSDVMKDLILSNAPYSNPGYLPMVINTYTNVYNIYPNLSTALVAPYDSLLPIWTDGTYSSSYVDNQMNQMNVNPPKLIIKPEVLDTFSTDSTHILRVLLKENDVYRWVPQEPLYMLYCKADEQVSYLNALKAYDYMTSNGAQHVSIKDIDSTLDHFSCAQFALLEMRSFFDTMRYDRFTIEVTDYQFASGPNAPNGGITLTIRGGQHPLDISWDNGQTGNVLSNVTPGTYTVTVTGNDGCSTTQTYTISYMLGVEEASLQEIRIYPNPSKDKLYVENLKGAFSIIDMAGRKVYSGQSSQDKLVIDISSLQSGMYIFQAENFKKAVIKE